MEDDNRTESSEPEDESEWEYEYHPDEYEEVFVMINLPQKNPARMPVKKEEGAEKENEEDIFAEYVPTEPTEPKPRPNKRRRRRRNPVTGELYYADEIPGQEISRVELNEIAPEKENGNDAENADEEDGNEENDDEENDADDGDREEEEEEIIEDDDELDNEFSKDRTLQIMDLNTKNPWISFQGQMYSCEWQTTLGTDMFFAKRPEITEETENGTNAVAEGENIPYYPKRVLHSLKEWDLIGMSSAQLVASSVDLEFRDFDEDNIGETASKSPSPRAVTDQLVGDDTIMQVATAEAVPGQAKTRIWREKNKEAVVRRWESKPNMTFLEQFNALRQAKGERLSRFENGRPFHSTSKGVRDPNGEDIEEEEEYDDQDDNVKGLSDDDIQDERSNREYETPDAVPGRGRTQKLNSQGPRSNRRSREETDEDGDPSKSIRRKANAKRLKLGG